MRQVSCSRCHATLALNTALAIGNCVLCADGHSVSFPRRLTTLLLVPLAVGAASVWLRRRFLVAYVEMWPASVERAFVSAGSSGQRE
jgi:hypothetical protein